MAEITVKALVRRLVEHLYEPTERINVFRKLFYGVGGSYVSKNKAVKSLPRDEINHRKRRE